MHHHNSKLQTKNELEQYWQKINRENQMRNQRNKMILGKLENLEEHMQSLSSKSNVLRKLREQYSEALETLNSVNGTRNFHLSLQEQQNLSNYGGYQSFKNANRSSRFFNESLNTRGFNAELKSVSQQTDWELNLCANCRQKHAKIGAEMKLDTTATVFGYREAVQQSLVFDLDDVELGSRGTELPKSETQKPQITEAISVHEIPPKNKPFRSENLEESVTISNDRMVATNTESSVSREPPRPYRIKENLFFENDSSKESSNVEDQPLSNELLVSKTAKSVAVTEPLFERSVTPSPTKTFGQTNFAQTGDVSTINASTDHEISSMDASSLTNQILGTGDFFNPPPKIQKEAENVSTTVENTPKPTVSDSDKPLEVPPPKSLEVLPTKPLEVPPPKSLEVPPPKSLEIPPTKLLEVHPAKPQEVHPAKPQEVHPAKPQEVHPAKPLDVHSNEQTVSPDSESEDSVQDDIMARDMPRYSDKDESFKNSPIQNKGVNAYQALLLGLKPSNDGNGKGDSSSEEDFEAHFASSILKKSEPKLENQSQALGSSKSEEIKKPLTADERRRIQKKMLNLGQDSDSDDEAFDFTKKTKSKQDDDDDFAFYG